MLGGAIKGATQTPGELASTWNRSSDQVLGSLESKILSGTVRNFKNAWKYTPFGVAGKRAKAHGAKQQSVLPDQPLAKELPFMQVEAVFILLLK